MPIYRHQVEFESVSGLAEDRSVNVWHSDSVDDAAAIAFAVELQDFYGLQGANQERALTSYYGPSIADGVGAHTIKIYKLSDPEPRVPIDEQPFSRATMIVGAGNLPREVAVCLSFQGTPTSGVAQARRRGRIFLGPLNTETLSDPVDEVDARPNGAFMADIIDAAKNLRSAVGDDWVVWSRAGDFATPVTTGWVDNAFDIQRRRGVAPTLRALFP